VSDRVRPVDVVAVVGGEERCLQVARDVEEHRVRAVLLGDLVVLQLDEEVVAPEDVLQPSGRLLGALEVVAQQVLEHMPTEAAGGDDQARAVVFEQLPVDAGLVVVALEEGTARELDEVAVALVRLRQRGEVVVELGAALRVTTAVVDAAAA
jgi:hypothetical protein